MDSSSTPDAARPSAARPPIGLRGDMGAGKDTLAEEICRRFPEYSVRKFATILREAVQIVTDIPPERTVSDADKAVSLAGCTYGRYDLLGRLLYAIRHVTDRDPTIELGERMFAVVAEGPFAVEGGGRVALRMTVGRLLQVLGTECFRNMVDPDVWVDAFFRRWDAEGRPPVVIADTRFPNETAAIRARGGAVVLVRRRLAARADGRDTRHASERALDDEDPDVAIDNDGAIADLGPALLRAWPSVLACAAARAPPA